jgi:hypothetical protein
LGLSFFKKLSLYLKCLLSSTHIKRLIIKKTRTYEVKKRPTDPKQAQWSERQKIEAVTTYLLVGKWPLVAEATGIPIDTLKKWKAANWWADVEQEVRRSSNIELGGKLQRIRDKALAQVEDRLTEGDIVMDPKTGKIGRRPVNLKTSGELLVKIIDRELLVKKLEEKPQLKEEAILDRLKSIEQALIRGAKKTNHGKIIDVDVSGPSNVLPGSLGLEHRALPEPGGFDASTESDLEDVRENDDDQDWSGGGGEYPLDGSDRSGSSVPASDSYPDSSGGDTITLEPDR